MRLISLTRGLSAIVDDSDYEWLSAWNWYALSAGKWFYAARDVTKSGKKTTILMHRIIRAAGDLVEIDHSMLIRLSPMTTRYRGAA